MNYKKLAKQAEKLLEKYLLVQKLDFKKLAKNREIKLIDEITKKNSAAAKKTLVDAYAAFVLKIAESYIKQERRGYIKFSYFGSQEALVEALIGLLKAVECIGLKSGKMSFKDFVRLFVDQMLLESIVASYIVALSSNKQHVSKQIP